MRPRRGLSPRSFVEVTEKVLGQLKDAEREALIEQIKPLLSQLKKFSYGKQGEDLWE
jgi:hypothetical protein